MPSRPLPSAWQLFAVALLLCAFGPRPASGQVPNFGGDSRQTRAPNPQASVTRAPGRRAEGRAKKPAGGPAQPAPDARAEEKQQAVERAISEGNKARDLNDYEQALARYQTARDLSPQDARALYGIGNVYTDIYCHDSAIGAYAEALKLKKDYLEALVGLGWAYVGKERYDEAEKQFRAAREIKRGSVEAILGMATVYTKKGNYPAATEQANLVLDDKSAATKDHAMAHVALGDVYWKQSKWPETIAAYEKAVGLNPGFAKAYIALGGAQMTAAFAKFTSVRAQDVRVQDREALAASARQAADTIQKAISMHDYNRPDGHLLLAYALVHQSRYREAVGKIKFYLAKIDELESRLALIDDRVVARCDYGFNRQRAQGHSGLGFVHLEESVAAPDDARRAELLNEAAAQYKRAVELREDDGGSRGMLGLVYLQQGKDADAVEQYEKAILFQGDAANRAVSYRIIGTAYQRLKRYEDAIKNIEESIRLNPDDDRAYEALASAYEGVASKHVAAGNLEETFRWLKKADEVRKTPSTNPGPYYYLGSTYAIRFLRTRNEEDFNEAVKWLKKTIGIKPDYAAAYQGLGIVYWRHLDADEALASLHEALKLAPQDANNHLNLASVYFDLKRNDEAAIGHLKKAADLKPSAEAYSRLGLVYHRKKDYAEAVAQILKAIETDPKYIDAYLDLAVVYRDQKNYAEAVKHINKAIELTPTDFRPYKELAKLYEAQQRNEDAIRAYEEAIKNLKGEIPWVQNLFLCRIERLRGRHAEAVGCFQKLTNVDDPTQIVYEIGLAHVAGRNKRAALEQHQQLVQSKSPYADELMERIKEMK